LPDLFSSVIFLNKARVKVVLASVKGVEDAIVSDTKTETWENNETLTGCIHYVRNSQNALSVKHEIGRGT
jgi:hypothetical protein